MRRWLAVAAAGLLIASGRGGPAADHAPDAFFDAPLGVTVTGVPPGRRITLTASATDSHGDRWRSSATFRPDSSGRIDLARTAPVAGDYTGAHDAGLLWSMTDPGVATLVAPVVTVHLVASLDGRSVATASLAREWAPTRRSRASFSAISNADPRGGLVTGRQLRAPLGEGNGHRGKVGAPPPLPVGVDEVYLALLGELPDRDCLHRHPPKLADIDSTRSSSMAVTLKLTDKREVRRPGTGRPSMGGHSKPS